MLPVSGAGVCHARIHMLEAQASHCEEATTWEGKEVVATAFKGWKASGM